MLDEQPVAVRNRVTTLQNMNNIAVSKFVFSKVGYLKKINSINSENIIILIFCCI